MVNFVRPMVVNFNRPEVVSLNRRGVVNFTDFCTDSISINNIDSNFIVFKTYSNLHSTNEFNNYYFWNNEIGFLPYAMLSNTMNSNKYLVSEIDTLVQYKEFIIYNINNSTKKHEIEKNYGVFKIMSIPFTHFSTNDI